ncbi:MAG: secondary thiamine-phosphate synthase enzyme YjbQ [Betaproteobacteria bacterium]|nr:secondary thiamine-phosphate synthase enzyme YjbQ [Betaproteobacteria bacterium]
MPLRQMTSQVTVETTGRRLYPVTDAMVAWIASSGIKTGLLTLFVPHTSASLLIQENYDPDVQSDLERFFARLVPDGDPLFAHVLEGPDDMPAHVRAALTQTHLGVPVVNGRLALGTWQGIYLYEHRARGQRRHILLHLLGDG